MCAPPPNRATVYRPRGGWGYGPKARRNAISLHKNLALAGIVGQLGVWLAVCWVLQKVFW